MDGICIGRWRSVNVFIGDKGGLCSSKSLDSVLPETAGLFRIGKKAGSGGNAISLLKLVQNAWIRVEIAN